mmetsp:Transcript_5149/g.13898  ORF Transcript_5149/g.13898 Transcript_5149/m.13898 type:complete len:90 (+) Transcript_5149:1286-1555(+)|eukprot:739358-Pelagomonas_calceolata.AAC.8
MHFHAYLTRRRVLTRVLMCVWAGGRGRSRVLAHGKGWPCSIELLRLCVCMWVWVFVELNISVSLPRAKAGLGKHCVRDALRKRGVLVLG